MQVGGDVMTVSLSKDVDPQQATQLPSHVANCCCPWKPQKFIFRNHHSGELSCKVWIYSGRGFIDWDTDFQSVKTVHISCSNANHSIWLYSSVPATIGIQNRGKLQSFSLSQSALGGKEKKNPSHSTVGEVNKKKLDFFSQAHSDLFCQRHRVFSTPWASKQGEVLGECACVRREQTI